MKKHSPAFLLAPVYLVCSDRSRTWLSTRARSPQPKSATFFLFDTETDMFLLLCILFWWYVHVHLLTTQSWFTVDHSKGYSVFIGMFMCPIFVVVEVEPQPCTVLCLNTRIPIRKLTVLPCLTILSMFYHTFLVLPLLLHQIFPVHVLYVPVHGCFDHICSKHQVKNLFQTMDRSGKIGDNRWSIYVLFVQ